MKQLFLPFFLVAIFTGCASVMNPTSQTISVQSVPSGAQVRVNHGLTGASGIAPLTGVTPMVFEASRSDGCTVIVSKPGYRALVVPVKADAVARNGKLQPNPIVVQLASFQSREESGLLLGDLKRVELAPPVQLSPVRRVPEKKPALQRGKADANGTEYL